MKKLWLVLSICFISLNLLAQEEVWPLKTNPYLYKEEIKTRDNETKSLDSTFVYSYDTLDIQDVWDDFSQDKFVSYPPDYNGSNVTIQKYYYLMDQTNSTPEPDTVKFCDTSKAYHDTISLAGGVTTKFREYPFPTHSIWVNDLDSFPIGGQLIDMYDECYALIDSVIDGVPDPTQDTIWFTNDPTFEQDSIELFYAQMNDSNKIWVNNSACRNYRFAINPWSLGVATLDGVDSTGRPYEFANHSAQGPADYLTSKPIDLSGTSNVFLQFLFQAEGHGDMPEEEDSLKVEFWDVDTDQWYEWWNVSPPYSADQWDTAFIAVPTAMLKNGFRFRIRNAASLSGALDHWHIDYVQLYENALLEPQAYKDLAVSYPLNTLLKDYTAVPWDHYRNLSNPTDVMIDTNYLSVYNSDDTPSNVGSDMYLEIAYDGSVQGSYNLPNPGSIPPWTSNWELGMNEFPFFVSTNHTYSAPGNDTMATFDVKINASADVAASNVYDVNDTTYLKQDFKNYYAYDDGSAEGAYGIPISNVLVAYEFNAYEADTLAGILMHFVPSVNDVSSNVMLLTIWNDINGQPGDILYQDNFFNPHYPEYGGSKNEFKFYEFLNSDYPSKIAVPKKFYVGYEQIDDTPLNIGFDKNIINNNKLYYSVNGSWVSSSKLGSVMMRPVFSTNINYTLGIKNEDVIQDNTGTEIEMYPNPANNQLNFSGLPAAAKISLYDMSGRLVGTFTDKHSIDISNYQEGVYIVQITDKSGASLLNEKLIIE